MQHTNNLDFWIENNFIKVQTTQYLHDLRHYRILIVYSRDLDISLMSCKNLFFSLQVRNTKALDFCIDFYFTKVRIIQYLRDLRHYQILNICSRDLLRNPRRTLQMLCDFVGVSCYSKFVELATRYLYSKASRSRYLIEWSNEQKEKVMEETQKYSFLKSLFSFDSD